MTTYDTTDGDIGDGGRGGVLWLVPEAWEDGGHVLGQAPLISAARLAETARDEDWRATWVPDRDLGEGPYAGWRVAALDTPRGRHYCAFPPGEGTLVDNLGRAAPDEDRGGHSLPSAPLPAMVPRAAAVAMPPEPSRPRCGTALPVTARGDIPHDGPPILWIDPAAWRERSVLVPAAVPPGSGAVTALTPSGWMRAVEIAGLRTTGAHLLAAPGTPYDGGLLVALAREGGPECLFALAPAAAADLTLAGAVDVPDAGV